MSKLTDFLTHVFLLLNVLLIAKVLSAPYEMEKTGKNEYMVTLENGPIHLHLTNDDSISSDSINVRDKRNIFGNSFERCLTEITDSFEKQDQNPLEYLAKKFGNAVADKIENTFNPQEGDYLTHYCRSAKSVINTIQDTVSNNGDYNWHSVGNDLKTGLNDVGSKFSDFIYSDTFKIVAGSLVGVTLLILAIVVLVKCCKYCCNSSQPLPEDKKPWRKGHSYALMDNMEQA